MNKNDWLVLTGYGLLDAGMWMAWKPLGLVFAGLVCLLIARAANQPKPTKER